ncbi:MAG: VacJ family lipoprotein [Elusimicrobia bacterium]|nr:VacJ family lipoprotein [Elusimicrobiota bacterium]
MDKGFRPIAASLLICFLLGVPPAAVRAQSAPPQEQGEAAEFEGFEEFANGKEEGPAKKVFDPLSGYNRFMFHFNDKAYLWVWKPSAKVYAKAVPESARVAITRAFDNCAFPARFGNSLFQLKFKKAGTELGRFLVNSTAGIGGLFDPADKLLGWRRGDEDFGQTLGAYRVGEGFPIVLPLLGPSNLRDALGIIPDFLMNPISYFLSTETGVGIRTGDIFNRSSLHLEEYESFKKDALDPYTFFREAYQQNRQKRIQE